MLVTNYAWHDDVVELLKASKTQKGILHWWSIFRIELCTFQQFKMPNNDIYWTVWQNESVLYGEQVGCWPPTFRIIMPYIWIQLLTIISCLIAICHILAILCFRTNTLLNVFWYRYEICRSHWLFIQNLVYFFLFNHMLMFISLTCACAVSKQI